MSSLRQILPAKPQGATVIVAFQYLSDLSPLETLTGANVVASVVSGVDPSPSFLISGADSTSGTTIRQTIIGGVVGVTYALTCTATTSLSQTLVKSAYLTIIDNPVT